MYCPSEEFPKCYWEPFMQTMENRSSLSRCNNGCKNMVRDSGFANNPMSPLWDINISLIIKALINIRVWLIL